MDSKGSSYNPRLLRSSPHTKESVHVYIRLYKTRSCRTCLLAWGKELNAVVSQSCFGLNQKTQMHFGICSWTHYFFKDTNKNKIQSTKSRSMYLTFWVPIKCHRKSSLYYYHSMTDIYLCGMKNKPMEWYLPRAWEESNNWCQGK